MALINCHAHTFTINHVPDKFLPYGLPVLLKQKLVRKPLTWIADKLWPFGNDDRLSRYSRFVQCSYGRSQEDLLLNMSAFYPAGTVFSVLPMDMAYMNAGKVPVPLEEQLAELVELRNKEKWKNRLRLSVPVDPRRFGRDESEAAIEESANAALTYVRRYVESHQFNGVKLYPMLGFWACDRRLWKVYEYCEQHALPVTTHCSRGGVFCRGNLEWLRKHPFGESVPGGEDNDTFCDRLGDPDQYRYVLQDFPRLKLNLAHYGGGGDWASYLDKPWFDTVEEHLARDVTVNWVHKINTLLNDPRFPNVHTDISYTLFDPRYIPLLKLFLYNPNIRTRVLYGTDFYMVEMDSTEREVAIQFRYWVGEAEFQQLQENNRRFLNI